MGKARASGGSTRASPTSSGRLTRPARALPRKCSPSKCSSRRPVLCPVCWDGSGGAARPAPHCPSCCCGGQRYCPPSVPREGAAVPAGSAPRPRGGAVLRLDAVTVLHSLHRPGDVLPVTTTSGGCRGGFLSAPRRPRVVGTGVATSRAS